MDSSSKKFLLFDNDGVLVETEFWYFKATQDALFDMGIELTQDYFQTQMPGGLGCWHLATEAGFTTEDIKQHKGNRDRYYQAYLSTKDIEIPGVPSVLEQLSRDFKMGIVTSCKRQDFELIHRDKSLLTHMSFVLASGEYPRAKPYPDPYLLGLEKLGATKAATLVIEDSERGLRSAVAAGIDCVMVHNEFTSNQDFSAATYRIDMLADLPALLAEI